MYEGVADRYPRCRRCRYFASWSRLISSNNPGRSCTRTTGACASSPKTQLVSKYPEQVKFYFSSYCESIERITEESGIELKASLYDTSVDDVEPRATRFRPQLVVGADGLKSMVSFSLASPITRARRRDCDLWSLRLVGVENVSTDVPTVMAIIGLSSSHRLSDIGALALYLFFDVSAGSGTKDVVETDLERE